MRYFFLTLILFPHFSVFAQQVTKGVIIARSGGNFKPCCVHVPNSGLTAYDDPHGKQIGKIKRISTKTDGAEAYEVYFENTEDLIKLGPANFYMIGYEVLALEYTDSVAGFIQVDNIYWIEILELESKGLELVNWMRFSIKKGGGWYANEPGLNLRTGPSSSSKLVATLKGDLFHIKPTSETNGLWCKVEVTEYKEHPCSGGKDLVIRTLTGWVKLISDDSALNVWRYGKGC